MGHLDNDHRQIFRNLFYPERERKLDIEKWVAYCTRAGATSVALDIKTQAYALYDSKLIQKDPAIGKRDFAAELSKAARKHGIKWCAYIPPYQHESLREKGRAWQERFEDGSIAAEKGGGFMKTSFCWNTPYLDLFCAILKEIALKYKPDGFYLDGMRYHGGGDRLTCYCDYCRDRFRKEYGLSLPSKKNGAESYARSMVLFLKARKKWIADATRAVRKAVDSVDPEITLYLNNKYGGGDWANSNGPEAFAPIDYVCREVIPSVVRGSVPYAPYGFSAGDLFMWECAAQRAGKGGKPGQLYVSLQPVMRAEDINLTVDLSCAVGAQFTMQERRSGAKEFLARIKVMEPYLKGIKPIADIALHYAEASQLAYYRPHAGGSNNFLREPAMLYKTLLDLHRPVEVVTDDDVAKGDFRSAKLIILPNSAVIPDGAQAKMLAHLKSGGSVMASMVSGTMDEFGNSRTADLIYPNSGLKLIGPIKTRKPYCMKMENGNLVFEEPVSADPAQYLVFKEGKIRQWIGEDIDEGDRPEPVEEREIFKLHNHPSMYMPADAVRVKADKTWKVLAALRFRDDVSGKWHESPAIVTQQVGRGSIIYCAFQMGSLFIERSLWQDIGYAWGRNLIARLVDRAIGPAPISIDAPPCVKASFWKQDDRILVHLVNELSGTNPVVLLEKRLPVAVRVQVQKSGFESAAIGRGQNEWQSVKTNSGWHFSCREFQDRAVIVCK